MLQLSDEFARHTDFPYICSALLKESLIKLIRASLKNNKNKKANPTMKRFNNVIRYVVTAVCLLLLHSTSFAANSSNNINVDLNHAYHLFVKGHAKSDVARYRSTAKVIPPKYRALQVAKRQINKRYKWGGDSPAKGFDCSGLVKYSYQSVNVNIPRSAAAQYRFSKRVSLKHLEVGDLIFFHTRRTRARVNHVGIYLGGNKFIHAPRRGKNVSVASLNNYWRKKFVGAGRV